MGAIEIKDMKGIEITTGTESVIEAGSTKRAGFMKNATSEDEREAW